jgi:hypothetical protein
VEALISDVLNAYVDTSAAQLAPLTTMACSGNNFTPLLGDVCSSVCRMLQFKDIICMRSISRQTKLDAQSAFAERWEFTFPCVWSAAATALGNHTVRILKAEVFNVGWDGHSSEEIYGARADDLDIAMEALAHGRLCDFIAAVKMLGPAGVSILDMHSFCSCDNDRTLLHYAVIRCDLPTTRWLLQRGASPNVSSRDGDGYGCGSTHWTPLHHAARNGDVPMCKLLLSAGADPNAQLVDPSRYSRDADFQFRASQISEEYVRHGSTAAEVAAHFGHKVTARLLRDWPQGAPPCARPPCLVPAFDNSLHGIPSMDDASVKVVFDVPVVQSIVESVSATPDLAAMEPRHRQCIVPGPIVPGTGRK